MSRTRSYPQRSSRSKNPIYNDNAISNDEFLETASNTRKRKFPRAESSRDEESFLQDLTHSVEHEKTYPPEASDYCLIESNRSVNAMGSMPKRHKIDTNKDSTPERKKKREQKSRRLKRRSKFFERQPKSR